MKFFVAFDVVWVCFHGARVSSCQLSYCISLFNTAGDYLEVALTTILSQRRLMIIRPISGTFMIFARLSLLTIGNWV